jgi:cytochrome c-type biogenesis protein CcmH/NrfF
MTLMVGAVPPLLAQEPAPRPPDATASAAPDTGSYQPVIIDAKETPPLARSIINETLSPFCPGLILAACPSPQADSLRKVIVLRVSNGDSRERIEADLARSFGDQLRAAPKAAGFGLVAWLAPSTLLLVGGIGIFFWLRGAKAPPTASASASPRPTGSLADDARLAATVGASPDELARLDALLRRDDG